MKRERNYQHVALIVPGPGGTVLALSRDDGREDQWELPIRDVALLPPAASVSLLASGLLGGRVDDNAIRYLLSIAETVGQVHPALDLDPPMAGVYVLGERDRPLVSIDDLSLDVGQRAAWKTPHQLASEAVSSKRATFHRFVMSMYLDSSHLGVLPPEPSSDRAITTLSVTGASITASSPELWSTLNLRDQEKSWAEVSGGADGKVKVLDIEAARKYIADTAPSGTGLHMNFHTSNLMGRAMAILVVEAYERGLAAGRAENPGSV